MSHTALLQMTADDGSSRTARNAMAAIEQIAAQALALQEAERQIAEMAREIERLNDHNRALLDALGRQHLEEIL